MDNNKKTNILIFGLIIIIVLLGGLLAYTITTNKNDNQENDNTNQSSTTNTTTTEAIKEIGKLITEDSSGNEYYAVYNEPEDDYPTLKIVSTKDKKNYQDILDLSFSLMSGYYGVPYDGYKIENNALYYINNDCENEDFKQGDEIKVTLNNNKYTLTKTGTNYEGYAGVKC